MQGDNRVPQHVQRATEITISRLGHSAIQPIPQLTVYPRGQVRVLGRSVSSACSPLTAPASTPLPHDGV